jgi:Phage integrase family.
MPIRIVRKKNVVRPAPQTLADVIDLLTEDTGLANRRRRDLISACNSTARLASRPAFDVACDVATLRQLFSTLHPVQGRISKKRLANIRADLAAALELAGVIPADDANTNLPPAWRAFLDKATQKHHAMFLSRLVRYCSHRQIEPASVTDAVMREFRSWLDARVLTSNPAKIVKDTAVAFNAIIKRSGLDIPLLTTAMAERHLARRLDTYPSSLIADIERYLKRLREPDLFSGEGPRRPLRPTSLRNVEANIRQTLDAAVSAGYPPAHFKGLADLVQIDVISAAVSHMIARRGGKLPSGLNNILATIMAIARHYLKLDKTIIDKIAAAQNKVGDHLGMNRPSMSEKSQRRMDQFETRDNIVRLANLPMILLQRAEKNAGNKSGTIDAMIAAAIAILLCCPMRIKNLSTLHMKDDMTLVKEGRNTVILIHISPDKTKGRQAIDAVIEPPYSTVIARYITHHRKHATDKPSNWLFPAVSGGARTPDHFGGLLKERIFRETGLTVNAHLFRHFSAYVFLEAHPGSYEDVRRVVGHAKMDTTTSFYAPASTKATFKRYGDVLRSYASERPRK